MMKLALQTRLIPTEEQSRLLLETMVRYNEACNDVAKIAYENRTADKIRLQRIVYHRIREQYGLSAQMTILAVRKVSEAYKRDREIQPAFDLHGAMTFDQRTHSWKGLDKVSILTLRGREIIPVVMGEYQKARFDYIRGQSDLIYRNGQFYLIATILLPEDAPVEVEGTLGVDLGIVNLATDSDGNNYSGSEVDRKREKHEKLKAELQECGSRSAKHHLRRLSGIEARFRRDINHIISKSIVSNALDTHRRIALENLGGIRNGVTVRKAQRRRQYSWGFYQLRQFVEYKAKLRGVPVLAVPPRGTSHICPVCGANERANRPDRDSFRCIRCGYAGSSDHVAAKNIAARADVMRPIVSGHMPQGQAHVL